MGVFTHVEISVTTIAGQAPGTWSPSFRIVGRKDGTPFVVTEDVHEHVFRNETAAMADGNKVAQRRLEGIRTGRQTI
ncbi:MAG: hypothetical protein ABI585_01660 [Betaproteobacteria bacterium]